MPALRAMIPIFAGTALLAASAVASAQPGVPPQPAPRAAQPGYRAAPPPPPPVYRVQSRHHFERRGFTYGLALGAGGMNSKAGNVTCADCGGEPITGAFSFHLGGMLSPRFALLFEYSGTFKQLDAQNVNTLTQSFALIAAQYWVSSKVWIKGGLGFAHLSRSYDDGFIVEDSPISEGGAVMGAVGYEIMSGPRFAIDVQLRLGVGTYDGLGADNQIQSGTVGVGFSGF